MKHYDYQADVCVVGAGPGGALLAYLLAKHGISTILVERNEHINKEFRGEHLNATGEEILRKYGLFEELEKIGLLRMERLEYWERGQKVKTILPDQDVGHVGIHVPQNHLLGLLLEKIGLLRMERLEYWDRGQKVKTILPDQSVGHVGIHVPQNHLLGLLLDKSKPLLDYTLLLNTKVVGLIEEDEHYLGVKAIESGKEVRIKSTIIVGADGRFSMVRKLAQFPVTKIHHGYDLLWARISAPANWEPTIRNAIVDDQQLALFTQQGGFIQIGWNIPEGSFSEIRKGSFAPFLQKLIDAFPELEGTVRENIQSWHDFILLQVQSSKSETWVKNNVVMIGDAAHTMSPTGAFGLNSSMKDAEVLFQMIVNAESLERISLAELKRFEKIRRPEVEEQQTTQLIKEASFGKQFASV